MSNYYNRQWRLPNNENKDKQSNYSMSFDGASSTYITAGNNNSLSGPFTGYTISAWAKTPTSWESDYNAIFVKKYSFYFGLNTNHYLVLNPGSGTAFAGYEVTSTTALNLDTWYHFLVTADGTNVKLYINGSLNKTQATTNTAQNSNTSNTPYIGGYDNAGDFDTWKGQLDAICFYDYALSASQVTTLYGSSSTGIGNPMSLSPVAFYQLGDKSAFNGANYLVPNIAAEEDDGDIATSYSPYALEFDGTNDYINCNTSLNGMSSISYSCWIKPEQPSGNYGYIIAAGDYSPTDRMLSLGVSSGLYPTGPAARELFVYGGEGSGGGVVGKLGYFVTYGTWYHIAIVYTNNQDVDLYVNGNAEGSIQYNDTASISSGSPTRIGVYSGTLSNYFNGTISNVSIWNAALTSAQVTEIYNEGVPSNLNNHSAYSNLVSWWQLGSNSSFNTNWTVLDEKGSNNGTSANMGEDAIVDGVGSYANGLSSGMGGDEVVGDAPYSSSNALSVNMDVEDRVEDTPS